mmetsp:Transcript_11825/g.12706  ORF Transcript_11825/g.12706 Transcript_11825/m.12706 type:complete len:317 (-) Transcript_11825:75-1025(-)
MGGRGSQQPRGPGGGAGGGGPGGQRQQQQGRRGEQDDPRRGGGGHSPNMMHADTDGEDNNNNEQVRQTLGGMRAFQGDEQLPNKNLFGSNEGGGTGPMGGSSSSTSNSKKGRRSRTTLPPDNTSRNKKPVAPIAGGSKIHRKHGLTTPPPSNPVVERKLEHFIQETLKDGPKPHFDQEMEQLLYEKFHPLFSWLKPQNVTFLRSVLITYFNHQGCQVDMDLSEASPKARREWDQLLDILSYELQHWTGEIPKIIEEPNHQWGIYGSKNVQMKPKTTPQQQGQGRGITKEEAARRKRRNNKAFNVSTDPTDPSHSMF